MSAAIAAKAAEYVERLAPTKGDGRYNQTTLGEELGVGQDAVSRWKRGDGMTVEHFLRLAVLVDEYENAFRFLGLPLPAAARPDAVEPDMLGLLRTVRAYPGEWDNATIGAAVTQAMKKPPRGSWKKALDDIRAVDAGHATPLEGDIWGPEETGSPSRMERSSADGGRKAVGRRVRKAGARG